MVKRIIKCLGTDVQSFKTEGMNPISLSNFIWDLKHKKKLGRLIMMSSQPNYIEVEVVVVIYIDVEVFIFVAVCIGLSSGQ